MKLCIECGKPLPENISNQVLTCSDECRRIRKLRTCKNWYINNLEKHINYYRKYRKEKGDKTNLIAGSYISKKKKRLMNYLGGKCQRCGYSFAPVLEFHHMAFNKDKNGWNSSKNIESLIKDGTIMLLCSNCHQEIHYGFNNWYKVFLSYK